MKKQNKKHSYTFWVLIAFLAALIAAPNPTVAKIGISEIGANEFNLLRLTMACLASLPLIFIGLKKFSLKNLKYSFLAGLFMSIALFTFVNAINFSSAGYVAILSLMAPIYLVLISHFWLKEKITSSSGLGVLLACAGAFIAVLSMQNFGNNAEIFNINYLKATGLMALNSISFAMSLIFARKATKNGLPIYSVIGMITLISFLSSTTIYLFNTPNPEFNITLKAFLFALYSGIAIMVFARMLNILCYKHLSSATIGSFLYIETFISLLIIIFIAKEKVPLLLIFGGITILVGIYLTQKEKMHAQHYGLHILKHH